MSPLFWPFWRQQHPPIHQQAQPAQPAQPAQAQPALAQLAQAQPQPSVPLQPHARLRDNTAAVAFAATSPSRPATQYPAAQHPAAQHPATPHSTAHPRDSEDVAAHKAAAPHVPASSSVAAAAADPRVPPAPEHRPEHRPHGRANPTSPTTPDALEQSSAGDDPISLRIKPPHPPPPEHPAAPLDSASGPAATATASNAERQARQPTSRRDIRASLAQSPLRGFRKAHQAAANRRGSSSVARLWNPTNSTPRSPPQQQQQQRRRHKQPPSTPPLPAIPLQHPVLRNLAEAYDPAVASGGSYPLLTLSEQRQSRHSASTRTSFQVERTGTSDRRISLPRSVRVSYDGPQSFCRVSTALGATATILGDDPDPDPDPDSDSDSDSGIDQPYVVEPSAKSKGKQKAIMTRTVEEAGGSYPRDLERGPGTMAPRLSSVSAADGVVSRPSSSDSSIMGEDVQPDAGGEWGPHHPCYPHLNPHVPVDSVEYSTTRIIRVKRDWLVAGDLAPTFSNLYPEILDPAGVSEQEFRRVIDKLNGELISTFDPFTFRNMLDSVLGLATGWLWDDFGLTAAKSRLNGIEKWIERWNFEMEKAMASEEGVTPPKLIPLRQTGYMNLDIQISDPEIAPAPSTIEAGDAKVALPMEPMPAAVTT